jgi:hypothetical protein
MAGDGNYGGNGSVDMETTLPDGQVLSGRDETANPAGNSFLVTLSYCISPVGVEEARPAGAITGSELREAKRARALQIQSTLESVMNQAIKAKNDLDAAVADPDCGLLLITLKLPVPMVTRADKPTGLPRDPWEINVHWD